MVDIERIQHRAEAEHARALAFLCAGGYRQRS